MNLRPLSVMTASATIAFVAITGLAAAADTSTTATSTVTMSCNRMTGLERAQCQVKAHQELMIKMGRASSMANFSSLASSMQSSAAGMASSMMSSISAMVSSKTGLDCAKPKTAYETAACLVLSRKTRFVSRPASSSGPVNRGRPSCTRYWDNGQRLACLQGKPIPPISVRSSSKSSSVSSSSSKSSASSTSSTGSSSSASSHS